MTTTYIIVSISFALIGILLLNGTYKLKLNVKNLNTKESFIVEKKTSSTGNNFLDWFYYDEKGIEIKDETLKKLIFEAFSEEDWYGDYEFYTKAKSTALETSELN